MFFTVPTILTWTRIVAIPLIVGVFYLRWPPEPVQNLVATVMFIVFAFTDWLDGYLARRLKQTSAFGAFLAISALREWMAQIGASRSVAVHMLGKVKTTVQMVAIPFLLYDGHLFAVIDTGLWGRWLIWMSAILTVWSMVYYLRKALPEIRQRVK
jgi:cardiolipin synthase (CMP-forming)